MNNLKILDCTLRDGGFGLEDMYKNGIPTEMFTEDDKHTIAELLRDSNIDIIEIGGLTSADNSSEGFSVYNNVTALSKYIPKERKQNQMYVAFNIDIDIPIRTIPNYSPELVDGIRVSLKYSQLQESLNYCKALALKGYKVFMQPVATMRYTDDDLKRLICFANEIDAYALYFVDSFGYMNERDVERLLRLYSESLSPNIKIGFHAHNNMENALKNAQFFIEHFVDRERIVDACAIGMGQGSGNLQTEIIVDYLNKIYGTNYDFEKILEICDILGKFRPHYMETWGYSPIRLIPAVYGVAYKYAVALKTQYNMSLVEINRVLRNVPDNLKHRYTPENLKQVLRR